LVTQFRYARFTLEGNNRDVALTERVDRTPCITFGQFRALAKRRGWTVDSLASWVKGELDEPKRTLERLLKTGPAETVIPYPCLTERYLKATATPAEGTTTGQGVCADGCGQQVLGRQKFARDACHNRAARRLA
jgi:hypothetical protein